MKYLKERQKIIDCAREMERYDLIRMSGGNVSLRMPGGIVLITPSAIPYNIMVPEDIVLLDMEGNTLEGMRRPSSDYRAILYLLKKKPEINAILHTHQPMAVALSLIVDKLPQITTTMVDEVGGDVLVAPYTVSSDEGMGIESEKYSTEALAVILKQHGVMAWGGTLEEALSAAVYLEESCRIYLSALATGKEVPILTKEQIDAENEPREFYGQDE